MPGDVITALGHRAHRLVDGRQHPPDVLDEHVAAAGQAQRPPLPTEQGRVRLILQYPELLRYSRTGDAAALRHGGHGPQVGEVAEQHHATQIKHPTPPQGMDSRWPYDGTAPTRDTVRMVVRPHGDPR